MEPLPDASLFEPVAPLRQDFVPKRKVEYE